jgi:signal recognition particle subunit SRP54
MFDQLSERLQGAFSAIGGGGQEITETNMTDALREVRRALLEADVNLRVIKVFLGRIQDRAVGEEVLKNLNPSQQLIKIVHEELIQLLGGENKPLNLEGDPNIIVMFGLQGSGKTTSSAKLALKLRKQGRNPLLIAADVYRPAAIQQLITLGKQVGIPVHSLDTSQDVLEIALSGVAKAKAEGYNTVIIDTAGRLQIDTDMMAELLLVERSLKPHEKLLVIDAMTGQESVNVAEAFNTQLTMTGIIVTKLDGDARGGASLSVVEVTGKPIKFIGTSEKMDGLESFHPERMATRVLGMGDVLSLVEKAQEAISLDEAKELEKKMRKQEFSLEDFLKMQKQMKMLGSFDQILGMLPIPGLTKDMRETFAHTGEKQMKRVESIIFSMTPDERRKPETINSSRRIRIAKGCGLEETEITQFLKQFEQMRMVMKQMTQLTDGMKKGKLPGGLHMPRKNKKGKGGGGFPTDMPGGLGGSGFPGFGGSGLPPGFLKGKNSPGGGFPGGSGGGKFPKGF